jgi:hypothetical protein
MQQDILAPSDSQTIRRRTGGRGRAGSRIFAASAGMAGIDATLRDSIARRKIPCVIAMAATAD